MDGHRPLIVRNEDSVFCCGNFKDLVIVQAFEARFSRAFEIDGRLAATNATNYCEIKVCVGKKSDAH